jgi:succinate dehydrogenase/fumarate reductase cytochrome b subunit
MSEKSPGSAVATAADELNLIRVQAASGLTFSVFLTLHLINTMLGSAGPDAYDGFQASARAFYQHPLFEYIVVLIPLVVHLGASITRILRRRRRHLPRPGLRLRLHRYSGWFLLAVISGHVSATRGVGFFFDAPPVSEHSTSA